MKFSNSLIKTRKEKVKEADSINADLLIRGNYIDQLASGVYTYLPLGFIVLDKIESIIRQEMIKVGGQEVLMPVLQPKENWLKSGRWETVDDLYRFTSYYTKTELVLGPTHEEVVVPLAKKFIFSYKDLPKYVFQIQNKFRDEKRAKAGLLRGREFLMKDLYSFHEDEKDLDLYYERMAKSYQNIFKKLEIGDKTYKTFATGGSFSKYSHEFQTESASGEDTIYFCSKCKVAVNKEIIGEQKVCPECGNKELIEKKAIEVGNIFKLKTKFSEPFDLKYLDKAGKEKFVTMGCYGIGLGRLLGAIVEVSHDERGIIWPKDIAPYQIHLVSLGNSHEVMEKSNKLYEDLNKAGFEVIWDDREESAGTKFADADLLGCPIRLVVSDKTYEKNKIEIKLRQTSKVDLVDESLLIKEVNKVLGR
ncbi:MAG: aminoacyl--tRNA ligase-related protein [Patescibacteria group bacterium]